MSSISAPEQFLLELINRARLDPIAEAGKMGVGLNQGLAAGTISGAPKQPLAPNLDLAQAANLHSKWMLDNNVFAHDGPGGNSAGDRMAAAGYDFIAPWTWSENLSWRGSTGNISASVIEVQHADLFGSPSHRDGMMLPELREAGIGQRLGQFTFEGVTYNVSMVTENFARNAQTPFVTGVTYNDKNSNDFYNIGEALGGIAVTAGAAAGTSMAAGGYALRATGADVWVKFQVDGKTVSGRVDATGGNVKVDLATGSDGYTLLTSADLMLGANVANAVALGSGAIDITGNGAANEIDGGRGQNRIEGGNGADVINGHGGNDKLFGQAGRDVLLGSSGNDLLDGGDANDVIFGGTGADTLRGGNHNDRLFGQDQNDLMYGQAGRDMMEGGLGQDTLYGGSGMDTMRGDDGNDRLYGHNDDDNVRGGAGRDTVHGGNGNDRVIGDQGGDRLFGWHGRDTLIGGNSQDTMDGGNNADTLTGSSGADTFIFKDNFGRDRITDFQPGLFEVIRFDGVVSATSFFDLKTNHLTDTAAGARIDLGGNWLILEDIAASELTAAHFDFV